MATGRKTGGREKGTPNKRTQDVIEKLEQLGCDPIEGMARIALQAEEEGDKVLAARMFQELAPYCAPKRKAIEQTMVNEWEGVTREGLENQLQQAIKNMSNEEKLQFLRAFDPEEWVELMAKLDQTH